MKNLTLREMTICALFIALITIGTFVRIPVGNHIFIAGFMGK